MTDIRDWANEADLNGEASPAGWPEGMPPSDVNNSAREMMAALRRSYVRQPWYAPGGEIVRVSGTQITIKDDAKVTNYSQYYTVGQRVRIDGLEYSTTGYIYNVLYESPTTTVEFKLDSEYSELPPSILDVYLGLNPQDIQGIAGPNLLGCIIGFTEEKSKIGAGLLHANGEKFSPHHYPDLAALYLIGTEYDGGPKYRYGREKVGDEWWPLRPDVRGYFPRFLDESRGPVLFGVDTDTFRNVGSVQSDSLKKHDHGLRVYYGQENTKDNRNSYIAGYNFAASAQRGLWNTTSNYVNTDSITETGKDETRPKNIAVVGVIVAYGGVVAGGLADVSEVLDDVKTTKELAQQTAATVESLGDVMRYCGSVDTYADLPTVDNQVGDVYNVLDTGANYAWTAAGTWDEFGGVIPDNVLLNNAPRTGSLSILGSGNSWEDAINIGKDSAIAADRGVAVGVSSYASGYGSIAIGGGAKARTVNSLALGSDSQAEGQWSAAIGSFANATDWRSLAIGGDARATAANAIQIGAGENNTPRSLQVSFKDMLGEEQGGLHNDYVLLTGDGKIPVERLPDDIGGDAGRVVQLGFNGVLEGGVLTFTPAEGSGTVYEIKDFYAYEIDLLFEAVGEIDDSVTMVIKNGDDTYNIVNVLHDDPTTAITVGDMKQIMKYSTDIGWRWIFNVRATTTQADDKVLVMPSTVANVSEPDLTGYLQNTATGTNGIAILGTSSSTGGIALGSSSTSSGYGYGVAIGASSHASARYAVSLGYGARTTAESAVQLGGGINSTERTLQFMSYPLLDANGKIPVERLPDGIGGGGLENTATGTNALALLGGTASGNHSVAIGANTQALGNRCITIGEGATTSSTYESCVAIGDKSTSTNNGTVAVGNYASATGNYGTAVGKSATASGGFSVALGQGASASGSNSTALGYSASATKSFAIQLGKGTNSTANTLSVGLKDNLNVTLLDGNGKIPGERMSLQGTTAPTTSTAGSIGQFYVDTATGTGYMCVGVSGSTYTWKQITV